MKKNLKWLGMMMIASALMACSQPTAKVEQTVLADSTASENVATAYESLIAEPDTANVVIQTIMARRSVRLYKDDPVPRAWMDVILKCGINAPNGMNAQPWEIRVVDSKEFLDGITALQMGQGGAMGNAQSQPGFRNMFRNAPTVVFIASKAGSGQVDCGLLGENMILAAQSLGLGSCCLGGPIAFLKSEAAAAYLQRLDFPEGYEVQYAIGMGFPDESPAAKPRDAAKVRYIE